MESGSLSTATDIVSRVFHEGERMGNNRAKFAFPTWSRAGGWWHVLHKQVDTNGNIKWDYRRNHQRESDKLLPND